MPTIIEMWLYALPSATIGFLLGRFRWWMGAPVLIWPILLASGGVELYRYDFVCESQIYENSSVYFASIICSVVLVFAATFVGMLTGQERERLSKSESAV
jgi:hypothetical protein